MHIIIQFAWKIIYLTKNYTEILQMKTQVDSDNQDHLSIPLLAVKLQQGKTKYFLLLELYFDESILLLGLEGISLTSS